MAISLRSVLLAGAVFGAASAKTQKVAGSVAAPKGQKTLTLGVLGDYGWSGWSPANDYFCNEVTPILTANNITIPRELQNDCDTGDRAAAQNASWSQ
ncbi:hypothetical protein F66182_11885, partial [Fusarium sp. NRRL 66182]